jgi:4-hydroxymandelate oxidase
MHKAREKFNRACYACVQCNGAECRGKIPGMGGYGSGAAFIRNCEDVNKILIKTRTIHDVKSVDTSVKFLDATLKIPLLIAPITGADINLGAQISEFEYDEEILKGSVEAGIFAFVGDGAQPYLYRTGLEALKTVNGCGGAIFKPRLNQNDIIKRIKESEDINVKVVGMDIDAAAFLTMEMLGQPVSTKTVYELKDIISSSEKPFIVKGVMTVEDAYMASEAGAEYIVVSNHGGRITDSHPSAISVLPAIKRAVDSKVKIILDGGLRSGEDIFKAIALGADYCMIGRPFAVAVLGGGREGVKILTDKYQYELKRIMLLTGAEKISDINENMIIHNF